LIAWLALTLAIGAGFSLGYRAALGRNQDPTSSSSNRAVSDKLWQTVDQVRNRFPLAKHEEFMRRAIANSRMAGIEKRTGGAFGYGEFAKPTSTRKIPEIQLLRNEAVEVWNEYARLSGNVPY